MQQNLTDTSLFEVSNFRLLVCENRVYLMQILHSASEPLSRLISRRCRWWFDRDTRPLSEVAVV